MSENSKTERYTMRQILLPGQSAEETERYMREKMGAEFLAMLADNTRYEIIVRFDRNAPLPVEYVAGTLCYEITVAYRKTED